MTFADFLPHSDSLPEVMATGNQIKCTMIKKIWIIQGFKGALCKKVKNNNNNSRECEEIRVLTLCHIYFCDIFQRLSFEDSMLSS